MAKFMLLAGGADLDKRSGSLDRTPIILERCVRLPIPGPS
jgi:hypothetical protein